MGDGGLRHPLRGRVDRADLPDPAGAADRAALEGLRREGRVRLEPRAARQDHADQGGVSGARPRHLGRRGPAGGARVLDAPESRRQGPPHAGDEPRRLRAARRAGQAGRRRDHHLHVGDLRGREGRHADPRQPRVEHPLEPAGHADHGGRHGSLVPAALPRLRAHPRLRVPLPGRVDRLRPVGRETAGQLHRGRAALLCPGAPRLREGPRAHPRPGAGRERPEAEALSLGGARRKGEGGLRTARGNGPGLSRPQGEDRGQARLREDPRLARLALPLRVLGRGAAFPRSGRVLLWPRESSSTRVTA